ncbi:MAG: methanogenesis marker protein Mmp4/MtxX [Promethearchaeota archaeon]
MFDVLEKRAKEILSGTGKKILKIGIGFNRTDLKIDKILQQASQNLEISNLRLKIYTNKKEIETGQSNEFHDIIECCVSEDPEKKMISDLSNGTVDGIIRGSLSSSKFLVQLKKKFQLEKVYRLALLMTAFNEEFFFAPVGIDEGKNMEEKLEFVRLSILLFEKLEIEPIFYLLSAGRLDDVKRNLEIKDSIESTIKLVDKAKNIWPNISIYHGQILIEDAFKYNANIILAPDGITGNLIYRTLIHLGAGHSKGAFYINENIKKPVIDTSRVGTLEEYSGAIILALSLISQNSKYA